MMEFLGVQSWCKWRWGVWEVAVQGFYDGCGNQRRFWNGGRRFGAGVGGGGILSQAHSSHSS